MKGTIEKKVLQVVEKVIGMEVKKNNDMWPPVCGGFVHQPKRPIPKKKDSSKNSGRGQNTL